MMANSNNATRAMAMIEGQESKKLIKVRIDMATPKGGGRITQDAPVIMDP